MAVCKDLLKEYQANRFSPLQVKKLEFEGVGNRDVYNITAPFLIENELVIAGRVENRDSESSDVYFFVEKNGKWCPKAGAKTFHMQDPFFTFIDDELVLGGVETYPRPDDPSLLGWKTVFLKGKTLSGLEPFFEGPEGMKDLRLRQLGDGKIGVFTRPQGEKGGRGKIGYTVVNCLEELSVQKIEEAPLLANQFIEEEWGGCNEIHVLEDGILGILGHIGSFDSEGNRHYYSMTFRMDPATGHYSDMKLLAVRNDFLPAEAKRPDLEDVVFSGGLVRHGDGTATLYAGIGDASAQCITLADPFMEKERKSDNK